MFYISYEQYKILCKIFVTKEIPKNNSCPLYSKYYAEYECDSLYELIDNDNVIGVMMIFNYFNAWLCALILQTNKSLVDLSNYHSFILSKSELCQLFSNTNGVDSVINSKISKALFYCGKSMNISTNICCVGGFNFEIKGNGKISDESINEYLICNGNSTVYNQIHIFACNNKQFFKHVQSLFNTIQYLYQTRTVNKAKIVTEGNGHVFFSTEEYIIGYQKYYNYLDSPLTYYVFDRKNNNTYIFAVQKCKQQVLRAAQALVAYSNLLRGGFNVHASAVVLNNKAILLLGDKESGKTTNMLYGLANNSEMRIMSNDIVHLYCDNGVTYAVGSCRKATIRPGTVSLFPKLQGCIGEQYSSVGNPDSKNMQLVVPLPKLAELFNTTTEYFAPVKLMVIIQYSSKVINPTIDWNYKVDWFSFKKKHLMQYYDGKQRFWNDVFPCILSDNSQCIKSVKIIHAVVSERNIKKTWELLSNY